MPEGKKNKAMHNFEHSAQVQMQSALIGGKWKRCTILFHKEWAFIGYLVWLHLMTSERTTLLDL